MSLPSTPLEGHRILVVEDDYLVAQILIELLQDAGAEVVGPIGWVEEAIAHLDTDKGKLSAAVLDINLHGQTSYPIADALISRSVPFVFTTGYNGDVIDYRYAHCLRCEKPFNQTEILAALASAAKATPQTGAGQPN